MELGSSVPLTNTVNNLEKILGQFGQRLHSKVPLELNHCYSFIDGPRIFAIAKIEKKIAWQAFIQKLFDLDDPDEDAVADSVRKFGTMTRQLINHCVAKHKAFKAKAEALVLNYIDARCKKIKTSIEEILLETPGIKLDLKGFIKTENALASSAFQHQWMKLNQQFYNDQKMIFMKKLKQLENELVQKQKQRLNVAPGPSKCGAKVIEHILDTGDDGCSQSLSDSMIVNISDSLVADQNDDVETKSNNVPVKASKSLRNQNVMCIDMDSRGGKRTRRANAMTKMQLRSGNRKRLKRDFGHHRSRNTQEVAVRGNFILNNQKF